MAGVEYRQRQAVQRYKVLTMVLSVLSIGMLVCAVTATLNEDEEVLGRPPYFVGGYSVGVTALLSTLMCIRIIGKSEDTSTDAKKEDIGRAIYSHYVTSLLMFLGSIVGIAMIGVGGYVFSEDESVSPLNKKLVLGIFIGCNFGLLVAVVSFYLMCTVAQSFCTVAVEGQPIGQGQTLTSNPIRGDHTGVHTSGHTSVHSRGYGRGLGRGLSRGHRRGQTRGHTSGQTLYMNTHNTVTPVGRTHTNSTTGRTHTNTTVLQTQQVNNEQVNQLQMQNQLLQQQLDLQRQLNQQQLDLQRQLHLQQQQQQQFGPRFPNPAYPPPPEMYPPPPNYDDVMK